MNPTRKNLFNTTYVHKLYSLRPVNFAIPGPGEKPRSDAKLRKYPCFERQNFIFSGTERVRLCLVREMKMFGCHIGCFGDVGRGFWIQIKKLIV